MSNQSKGRVQCPKCMGNRYLPIRSGSTSVRSCDRCGAEGWVEDPTPEPLSSNGLDQNEGGFPPAVQTPPHYQSSSGTTPWDLQRGMKSSGNAFVDGRRCDAIKYAFRVKQNMAEDLRKAAHCLMEAVAVLEAGGDKEETPRLPGKFHPYPLGVYNDWEFWKTGLAWEARCKTHYCGKICRAEKEALFAEIDKVNAQRKEQT